MANPFDQFDNASVEGTGTAPQPVTIHPGQAPVEAAVAGAPVPASPQRGSNPFDNLDAAPSDGIVSQEDFDTQFYDKLNAGESPADIISWSKSVGHEIVPNENFYENIRIRDEALRNGQAGSYGRVQSLQAGEAAPGDALGAAGAFARQAGNTVLFNFGDEIEAGLRAIPTALTSNESFDEAYRARHAQLNDRNDLDWELHPAASGAGVAVGALGAGMATPSVMNIGRVRDAGLAARAAAGAGEGAVYGAASAVGEGTPDNRLTDAGAGALIGGGIGGSVSPAAAAIARLGRPVIERLVPNEAAALARRLGYSQDQVTAARQELARQQELGITDATLFDVIDEPSRRVVGSAGSHDAARESLQDFAASRQVQLPERVGAAANETIAPTTGAELGVVDDVRSGIIDQRDAEIAAALDAPIGGGLTVRSAPLSMTPEIADVLGTTNGQRALRNVINSTADTAERQGYEQLLAAARTRARGVAPGVSEDAQQAAQGVQLESMPFTIGMSERIGRELNNMGRQTGNSALFSFGRTVRSGAEQSPAYRDAMARYGQMSSYADAPGVGSGVSTVMDEAGNVSRVDNEGAGFMAEDPLRFETRVGNVSAQPMVDAAGTPVQTPSGGTVSPRDLTRLGAAEQVAQRAGKGPGEARGVAEQLYDSPAQRARSVALLGEEGADRLAGRMREEVRRVYRAASQATKEQPGREAGMAAVESGVNALYTPGPISALRETARFLHRIGLSERDALWIVRNATDPAQTNAILNRLEKAGLDRLRAQAYVDQLRDAGVRYFTASEEN